MRTTLIILTAALLLATAPVALAQQDALPSKPFDNIDVSFRSSSFDGDAARLQRYQDLRDKGAGLSLNWNRLTPLWAVYVNAKNVGYNDQQFAGSFQNSNIKASLDWNQTPLFYSDSAKTPYASTVRSGVATFTLDQATRLNVQNNVPGYVGIVTSPTQAGSSFTSLATGVDLRARRDNVAFKLVYSATKDLDVKVSLNSFNRTGTMPWGASFAFNDTVELAVPLDNRTTNLSVGAEWARRGGMFRVGYEGSYFDNSIQTLVWDNPFRATDATASNAYSNGAFGSSSARMALWPSNHVHTVNAGGLLKLPARSSLNGSFSVASFQQNEALLPHTINSILPVIPLPRTTAEGDIRVLNTTLNFSSRPFRHVAFTAKYRYYDKNNRTPIFDTPQNVRFDGVVEDIPWTSEPVSVRRQSFSADASFAPVRYTSFKVGYSRLDTDRTYRMFESSAEDTLKLAADMVGKEYVTVRAIYERSKRTGSHFDAELLTHAGQQPEMRQYDVANRHRDRGTLLFELTPVSIVGFSASLSTGSDEYPDQEFGLLNNDNRAYTFGVTVAPSDKVSGGVTYGHEKYTGLQASRSANPPPDPTFINPARNWSLDSGETVRTYGATLDVIRAVPKTEIRCGYHYSHSDQAFLYSGPWIQQLITLNTFSQFPNVTNTWQRGTADVRYFLTARLATGFTYWYDRYDVNDFSIVDSTPGTPRVDPIGGLILGYGYRPFKANTGFFRVMYFF